MYWGIFSDYDQAKTERLFLPLGNFVVPGDHSSNNPLCVPPMQVASRWSTAVTLEQFSMFKTSQLWYKMLLVVGLITDMQILSDLMTTQK